MSEPPKRPMPETSHTWINGVPKQPPPNTTPIRDGGGVGVGFLLGVPMIFVVAAVLVKVIMTMGCG